VKELWRCEKGSVLLIAVLLIAFFVGMSAVVTETGRFYLNKSQMQNAADAAALAGAQELKSSVDQAKATAYSAAQENGLISDDGHGNNIDNVVVTTSEQFNGIDTKITVKASRSLLYGISKLLGGATGTKEIPVQASAVIGAVVSYKGLMPFGLPEDTYTEGEKLNDLIWPQSNNDLTVANWHKGWAGWLYLNEFKPQDLINPEDRADAGQVALLSTQELDPGTMQNLINTYSESMPGHETHTYENYQTLCPNCPKLVYVPIIRLISEKDKDVLVVNFAALFLDTVDKGDNTISGHFVKTVVPDAEIDQTKAIVGLYGVKLVE